MTEDQIKHLANRFLGWAIPDDFHPDNGVHFDGWIGNKGVEGYEYRRHLTGTNLLNANQAEAMVRHIIEGIPPSGEIERLRKHADAMAGALEGNLDDDECWHDHHGYCQAHYVTSPCEVGEGKRILAAYRAEYPEKK